MVLKRGAGKVSRQFQGEHQLSLSRLLMCLDYVYVQRYIQQADEQERNRKKSSTSTRVDDLFDYMRNGKSQDRENLQLSSSRAAMYHFPGPRLHFHHQRNPGSTKTLSVPQQAGCMSVAQPQGCIQQLSSLYKRFNISENLLNSICLTSVTILSGTDISIQTQVTGQLGNIATYFPS